jgi:hypothetical protein
VEEFSFSRLLRLGRFGLRNGCEERTLLVSEKWRKVDGTPLPVSAAVFSAGAMNSPSPALSIFASPPSETSIDPDILVEDAVDRQDAAPLVRPKSDAHRFEMERYVCNGRQFGCGDHCSCNCRWRGGGLCGPEAGSAIAPLS